LRPRSRAARRHGSIRRGKARRPRRDRRSDGAPLATTMTCRGSSIAASATSNDAIARASISGAVALRNDRRIRRRATVAGATACARSMPLQRVGSSHRDVQAASGAAAAASSFPTWSTRRRRARRTPIRRATDRCATMGAGPAQARRNARPDR
jgi:hypothetical protein